MAIFQRVKIRCYKMDRAYGTRGMEVVIFINGLKPVATRWIVPMALGVRGGDLHQRIKIRCYKMDRAYGTRGYGGVFLHQRVKTRCYNMLRAYGSGQCVIAEMITAFY